MSRFLDPRYAALEAYTPGEQPNRQYIKLNTNESPYPPSPRVKAAIDGARIDGLRYYADPAAQPLAEAIAAFYGVSPACIVPTGGSDEALGYLFLAYCTNGRRVFFPDISYGFYAVFAQLTGADAVQVPLDAGWNVCPRQYDHAGGTVLIANPNAPTGLAFPLSEVETLCASNPDNIVVIDEAYADFCGRSAVPLIQRYENLVVVQTFSKSRCLAGARIGFAAASPAVAADLNRMKFSLNPYDIDGLAQVAGVAAMEDRPYFESCVARVIATREHTRRQLLQLGCTVLDSETNFLFVNPVRLGGQAYFEALRDRGILVRHFPGPRTGAFVRVTIGSEQEMEQFIAATREILSEVQS